MFRHPLAVVHAYGELVAAGLMWNGAGLTLPHSSDGTTLETARNHQMRRTEENAETKGKKDAPARVSGLESGAHPQFPFLGSECNLAAMHGWTIYPSG